MLGLALRFWIVVDSRDKWQLFLKSVILLSAL